MNGTVAGFVSASSETTGLSAATCRRLQVRLRAPESGPREESFLELLERNLLNIGELVWLHTNTRRNSSAAFVAAAR